MEDHDEIVRVIRSRMEEHGNGRISFRDYMEICLYHPHLGYYMSDRVKIGREGDFYTAADVGGIMAKIVALFFAKEAVTAPHLRTFVEWGGGTGRTAGAILDTWRREWPELYPQLSYILIEKSPYHRTEQIERLAAHADRIAVMSEQEWEEWGRHSGIFHFSQELLDAFPIHRLVWENKELKELFVEWDDTRSGFREVYQPCTNSLIHDYLRRHGIRLAEGQQVEVNLEAEQWLMQRLRPLVDGRILTVDYGDESRFLYAEERHLGTLMGYRQHRAIEDPYRFPGSQDLTAHVNFTALLQAGVTSGAREAKLWNQRDFLLENGALDLLSDISDPDPFHPAAKQNRAVRQLLLADRMSIVFKVLYQSKTSR
ncbi:class I SAM-dependent methyltransferase [Gorillibacterium timonense]|uniref:class I SAM-dependent methyltransferase n=1 Tax=Gorillibacterium timonense TaxID=1689269 RepID=UPI00071DC183|nr:SAM-dependent methyltransferase [Gorillibacterium timonense]